MKGRRIVSSRSHSTRGSGEPRRSSELAPRWASEILLGAAVPVLVLDPSGNILYGNPEVERLYGWKPRELAGMPVTTLVPLEGRRHVEELLERCRSGELVRDAESWWWTRQGEEISVLVSFSRLVDERGRPEAIACLQKDLRAQKRAEAERRESEERFRLCQVAGSYGTWDWDLETQLAHCSDAYFSLYGIEPTATRRRTLEEWKSSLHPEDADRVLEAIRRAFATDEIYEDEFRVVWPDGTRRWLAARGKIFRDVEGIPTRMFGVNIDITDRKEAELARNENAELLRAILDASADAVITIDRTGLIREMNPAISRIFGYEREELLGRNVSVLMPPPHREHHQDYIEAYLSTGEAKVIGTGTGREVIALRKDGSEFPAELSVSEVEHLGLFTGIVRDVSARKEAEARERALADALHAAEDKERQKLAHFLHDDLQQLLVAAKLQVDQLEQAPSPEDVAAVAKILAEALDATRTLSLEMHPPALGERGLAPALEWLAHRMATHHQLDIEVEASEDAGSHRGPAARLGFELARELLLNVAKHSGARRARLELRNAGHEGLELVVSDGGRGFDPGSSSRSASAAPGFGLASIRDRVRLARGDFEIESAPGRGTRATVRLPSTS